MGYVANFWNWVNKKSIKNDRLKYFSKPNCQFRKQLKDNKYYQQLF